MGMDGRSNHLGEEEEEAEVADLNAEEAMIGVVEEAASEKEKLI